MKAVSSLDWTAPQTLSFLLLRLWWPSGGCPNICCITCTPSKYLSPRWCFGIVLPLLKCPAGYSCTILDFLIFDLKFFAFVCPFSNLRLRSLVGMNPGFSDGGSQIHQPDISQMAANGFPPSKMSTFVSNTHCGPVSSTQIPTVCFDLGNEWDDFEDENLLCASEESLTLCPANAKHQHSQEKKLPGRGTQIDSLHQPGRILLISLCFHLYCRCHHRSTSIPQSLTSQSLWNHHQ